VTILPGKFFLWSISTNLSTICLAFPDPVLPIRLQRTDPNLPLPARLPPFATNSIFPSQTGYNQILISNSGCKDKEPRIPAKYFWAFFITTRQNAV
jgi:hypothetical protein